MLVTLTEDEVANFLTGTGLPQFYFDPTTSHLKTCFKWD